MNTNHAILTVELFMAQFLLFTRYLQLSEGRFYLREYYNMISVIQGVSFWLIPKPSDSVSSAREELEVTNGER